MSGLNLAQLAAHGFAKLTGTQRTAGALAPIASTATGSVEMPYGLTYPAIRPSLDLDFANGQTVDPRITFTRASTATRTNSKGLIEAVASGVPRIDFDPVTGACKGLLIEEQRANLLLNSATLATQSVTVAAVAHTISFYGTGTVTLSGVATGSLAGSGAYPARSTLTFTPTAGTLVLTVTGSCTDGQIEAGSFATSVIPTVASQVTRAADVATMTGVNFSSWYRQDEGSFVVASDTYTASPSSARMTLTINKVGNGAIQVKGPRPTAATGLTVISDSGVTASDLSSTAVVANTKNTIAIGLKLNDFALSTNGGSAQIDPLGDVPASLTHFHIGSDGVATQQNGHIYSVTYYPKRLTNAELVALSTQ